MFRSIPSLILIALCAVSPVHAQSKARTATIQSTIPPQALTTALETWSKQSGIQVMYAMDVTQGLKSQGAPKGISADEALKKILNGTGLTFRVLNDRSVSVVPEREAAQGEAADQMRVADKSATASPMSKSSSEGSDLEKIR